MISDLKKLYDLLDPGERKKLISVGALMILAAVLQAASAGSLFPFLNLITNPEVIESGKTGIAYDLLPVNSYHQFLLVAGAGVFGILLLANGASSAAHWMRIRFQQNVTHNLSVRLMKRYLARDYDYFLNRNTAKLHQNILSEAGKVSSGLLGPVLKMVSQGAIAVSMLAVMLFVDTLATLIVIGIVGGGYTVAYTLIRQRLKTIGERYKDANRERYKTTAEAFGGIKDVKLLGREQHFLNKFKPASNSVASTQAQKRIYSLLPKYIIEALAIGSLVAIVLMFLVTGRPVATIVPTMGVLVYAGYRIMPALRSVFNAKASFRFTDEIFESIQRALKAPDVRELQSTDDDSQAQPLSFDSQIRLEDVTYKYPGVRQAALKDISISIPKGSAAAFVGETGAGKTTIIDVLLGLLTPTEGKLTVDGTEITPRNAHRWQANLGYVPQEIYLADTTIRRNIAYGLPGHKIDEEAILRAAKTAQIHDFISSELPDGYDTVVGENGVRLSGGQRQRVGIARALYHDPPVLVFDEATSDIDGATEAMIAEAIEDLQGKKTLIVVAHRFKTIRGCDEVFLVDQGRILASGKYGELLRDNPTFRKLAGDDPTEIDVETA